MKKIWFLLQGWYYGTRIQCFCQYWRIQDLKSANQEVRWIYFWKIRHFFREFATQYWRCKNYVLKKQNSCYYKKRIIDTHNNYNKNWKNYKKIKISSYTLIINIYKISKTFYHIENWNPRVEAQNAKSIIPTPIPRHLVYDVQCISNQ